MPSFSEMTLEDLKKVDEERISIGTDYQDCALIAQAFEKACHSTPTEAAALAPLNRLLENTQAFAKHTQNSLQTYLTVPEPEASSSGTAAQTDANLQALNIGSTTLATQGNDQFGSILLDKLKECIPCSLRIISYMELHPNLDLIGTLKLDILNRLKLLRNLAEQLKDLSVYGGDLAKHIDRAIKRNPNIVGQATDKRNNMKHLLKQKLKGKARYKLHYMLDTALTDIEKYPLKLSDLIVMDLDYPEFRNNFRKYE
jgi:hypothetical protein